MMMLMNEARSGGCLKRRRRRSWRVSQPEVAGER
jgi:hypothetical protein